MRNLILQTFLLALLIPPLSLSSQNSFSLSLDVNGSAGNQAVTSLNMSADQVVAIQMFATDIQNANGLAVRFEYDASQVTYEGFDTGNVLPNAQALPEQGTNPTFVEIGIASLGGQATVNSGLIGTARFRTTATFSGTAIRLVRAELSRGGRFETIMPNIRIALQGAPTNFSLSLDVEGSAGDQAVTSVDVSTEEMVAIQIFGTDIQNANGVSIRFEYDASQVTYEGFDVGDALPNAQALPEQGTNPTFVEIGIVSFGGQATTNSGLIGTIRFRTTATFSGTAIRLVRADLGRGGRFETITPNVHIELQLQALTPDFDSDGRVGFSDFLLFGSQFGARQGDGRYEARFDLDSDGAIGFGDFLIFGSDFGKEVSSGGSGGGSGGGSPDLIVESLSVSDSTLTAGQSFTLQATVRNQGSSQSAATTLRYYQSSDATITVNDTQVGTDAVGSLNASVSSAESISLKAPSSAGTYYYGACVEQVEGEPEIDNNCSGAVRVSVSGGTGLVAIPDENLRAAIETALGKTSGAPISRAEMASLTHLEAPNLDISDLTGLEFATNLYWLDLGTEWVSGLHVNSNHISDLSPLSGLNSLTNLVLKSNFISDVSALSGLTNLKSLSLGDNFISDVSALSGLTNLTYLSLFTNLISDVSALSGLTNLEILELSDNTISNVSALAGMTRLEWLSLSNTLISDVSALSGLTNLTYLSLFINLISDITPLANLTKLTSLRLEENTITNISSLAGMTNLTDLQLGDNLISDVSALSGLTNLESLNLRTNLISDITPLANLTKLTSLRLKENTITNISSLAGMTRLEWLGLSNTLISDVSVLSGMISLTNLYLRGNTISSISPLAGLTRLKVLVLWENAISDVSALSGMTNLTFLDLDQNTISSISPLAGMTNLENLYLSENLISNISPLANLTNLTRLYLGRNSISDLSPLVVNTGLGSGDVVDVKNNPLSATSINTHIPTLQDRGVTVQFGSSKPAIGEELRRMPHVVMDELKGVAGEHRGDLFEQGSERAYLYKRMKGESVQLEWNPSAGDEARRMPHMLINGSPNSTVEKEFRRMSRAAMKPFGVGAQEEAEYMSRRWMAMGEDVISQKAKREIRSTSKTDERDRRRMEIRQDMISRKASLRDKARREIKSTTKTDERAGTSED